MALGKTVGQLEQEISSEELTEWAAYYQLDPFGNWRGDLQAAIVASTMANIHATKGHKFTPKDFMPDFDKQDARPMKPEEIMSHFRALMMGGV